jgi:hypothetical protein
MWNRNLKNKTLVLNQDYIPLKSVHWKHAMTMIYIKETCIPLEFYERTIQGTRGKLWNVPAVVITKKYVKRKWGKAPYTKQGVFIRDKYKCQYCGTKDSYTELQIEHVIPRCQGGKTTWNNCVASCRRCNQKKGNMTPKQADMKLLKFPRQPDEIDIVMGRAAIAHNVPPEWKKFLQIFIKGRE